MTSNQDANFETGLNTNFMLTILSLGENMEIDPLSSIEAEKYFLELQQKVARQKIKAEEIKKILKQDFLCLGAVPVWIQGEEWQYEFLSESLTPMIFVGQIDAPEGSIVGNKSFYLFQSKASSDTKVVVQVD
jgi:hypothetical protein